MLQRALRHHAVEDSSVISLLNAVALGLCSCLVQGLFGRGRQAVLFKWSGSSLGDQWGFYSDEKGDMRQIGLMAKKPTNEDMETMVHNASAAGSPWAAGAKAFAKLTKKVSYNNAQQ